MLKRLGITKIHDIPNRKEFLRDKIPQILKENGCKIILKF